MRWLGVDAGEARVGLAISDPDGRYAVPLEVVAASAAFPAIRAIVEREEIVGIVLGLARLPSGDEGDAARMARRLGSRLERLGVPVEYEDETLTSQAVEGPSVPGRGAPARGGEVRRVASDRGGSGSGSRPSDDLAASLILQQFLDQRASLSAGDDRESSPPREDSDE